VHTGDFGFFEANSLDRINDRTLRHLTMYSPLIPSAQRTHLLSPENPPAAIRATVNISLLSEFPLLLSSQIKLQIPVYSVWGACEDVTVLEKFRAGTYSIENLHVLDEATTRCLDLGGVKLRLLGLGGALVPHKMFDNGDGNATIAGGQGTMWTTALQIGELVDTAQRVFDQSETRLLVTHASPGREGVIAQLALVLKADLTISAGLHFRYATSYNEFSVQGDFDGFRHKLVVGKEGFDKVWESVKSQVDTVIDENQKVLLDKALSVIERVPLQQANPVSGPMSGEEPAWKNCWNWNLCDAAYGSLIFDIKEGRVSAELRSQGFNYAYRRTSTASTVAATPISPASALPSNALAADRTVPPNKSNVSTPPSSSGKETPKEKDRPNGAAGSEKADKEKAKKKDKKDRKDKEKAERDTRDKDGPSEGKKDEAYLLPLPKSGKETPPLTASTSDGRIEGEDGKSPATESTGARTPTTRRLPRNPWTLFMRMAVPANEAELREFFGEAKSGITRINYPTPFAGRPQRLAYVEFGDAQAMQAGLEKHAEKLKDTIPEVKQATDKESRGEGPTHRGGRGGGRGGRGGFAARGFAAAGLTKGPNERRPNGDTADGPGA
jgi:hypothetical protein